MSRLWNWLGLAAALTLQSITLYAPQAPSVGGGWGLDKIVHATVFALVAAAAIRCEIPLGVIGTVLVGYAGLSELIQAVALADRRGDPQDVLADVIGCAAVLLWRAVLGSAARPQDAVVNAARPGPTRQLD